MTDPHVGYGLLPVPLVLDIETVPLADALAVPYDPEDHTPPANYKTDEAIAAWHHRQAAEYQHTRIKQCSINPRLGRVCCLGLSSGISYAATESDEAALLQHFWTQAHAREGRIVTWNGAWDLRFLLVRSLAHGLAPQVHANTIKAWFRKYTLFPHFDVKAALLNFDVRVSGEGLDEWSRFFGLAGKRGVSGADVYTLHSAGKFAEVQAYCESDVNATAQLYQKLVPYFV